MYRQLGEVPGGQAATTTITTTTTSDDDDDVDVDSFSPALPLVLTIYLGSIYCLSLSSLFCPSVLFCASLFSFFAGGK